MAPVREAGSPDRLAPKATPMHSPSGMLWMVTAKVTKEALRMLPSLFFPLSVWRCRNQSPSMMIPPPRQKPSATKRRYSARSRVPSMAGSSMDQTEEAIMTPPPNPSRAAIRRGPIFPKKITVNAPREVTRKAIPVKSRVRRKVDCSMASPVDPVFLW